MQVLGKVEGFYFLTADECGLRLIEPLSIKDFC
jgi:hypothetical protein